MGPSKPSKKRFLEIVDATVDDFLKRRFGEHSSVDASRLREIAQNSSEITDAVEQQLDADGGAKDGSGSTGNLGHASLGLRHYAHCSSPIRRFSDLLNQHAVFGTLDPRGACDEPFSTREFCGRKPVTMALNLAGWKMTLFE